MNAVDQNNLKLISYCGFYCGACPTFKKGKCEGCKGDSPKCAIGYKACKVRPCCLENEYNTCADCTHFESVKDCKTYNPFLIKLGQFLTKTNRRKGLEMIKEKGTESFLAFMTKNDRVTMKK